MAQDLYDELTERGYKVFFSGITLEDKLGQEYEPYIFAALSSARVMLAVGTKREYYDAVWVKNEWSRYLSLMQKDRKKTLIPCYRDMDAYDMPAEFKNLQGQDMGRLGFVQDLVRGIDKLIPKKAKEVLSTPETDVYLREVKNLIKRGNVCLEDKNYENAAKFFEQALNKNVEEPQAHLGKLLSDLRIPNEKSLSSVSGRLDQYESYRSAYRFGDKELQKRLDNYNTQAKYRFSSVLMDRVTSYEDCVNVEKLLEEISGYKDVDEKKKLCHEMKNSYLYQRAIGIMQSANTPEEYEQAQKIFHQISGYKESDQYLLECGKKVKLTSGFANRIRLKLLEKGRDFGTVSLINSIIGLLCCVIPIFAVLAIAFGVLSRKFEENSRVKASIGIVLGVLEILFFIINFISGFAIL